MLSGFSVGISASASFPQMTKVKNQMRKELVFSLLPLSLPLRLRPSRALLQLSSS